MIVLLSLTILISLCTVVGILVQLVFFGATILISQTEIMWLVSTLFTIQIAGTLFLMYCLKQAIDYNFQLVLEKTHLVDCYYTKHDYNGSKKIFLIT